jgi:hypothetical protein
MALKNGMENGWRKNLRSATQNINDVSGIKPDIDDINLEL